MLRGVVIACFVATLPLVAAAQDDDPEAPLEPPTTEPPTTEPPTTEPPTTEPPTTEPPGAEAQPSEAPPGTEPVPALPPPTLEEEDPVAPAEPAPDPEEQGPDPEVLYRIQADENAPEPDVAFETPGDMRTSTATQGRMPSILEPAPPAREPSPDPSDPDAREEQRDEKLPPPFELAAGVGYTRLLGASALDYLRVEERFEVRIPDFEALRIGVGFAQMIGTTTVPEGVAPIGGDWLLEAGVRIAFGFFFCRESWVRCEGVIALQPGVFGGDRYGATFDIYAGLDLRFVFEDVFELTGGGAYSLVGTNSVVHGVVLGGVVF